VIDSILSGTFYILTNNSLTTTFDSYIDFLILGQKPQIRNSGDTVLLISFDCLYWFVYVAKEKAERIEITSG